MALEARLYMDDPKQALIECAFRGIPGPIVADNECDCGCVHVVTICEDDYEAYEAFEDWATAPDNETLLDVAVMPS